MLHSLFRRLSLYSMLAVVAGLVLISGRENERTGDNLQIGLPLLGLACAVANGRGVFYVGRYLVLETAIKTPKHMLGDLPLNLRPTGGDQGFPSGHTAAATFGAVGLAQTCLRENPAAQGVALLSAGFVGGSRIEAGKHTIVQVIAGALVGWLAQVLALTGFDRMFASMVAGLGRLASRVRRGISGGGWSAAVVLATALAFVGAEAKAEFEVSLYTGWQNAHSNDVSGTLPGGGNYSFSAGWDGKPFAAPPHYGIRGTWWWREEWGVHFDFNHTKAYADGTTLASSGFQRLEFTDGLNNITLGLTRRWLDQWGGLTPYAGFGVGVAAPHVDVQPSATAPHTFGYQVVGPNIAWMAGVSYDLSDHWRLFGEYKGTYSWIDADLDGGGSLETEMWTNALNIGLSYVFGK